MRKPIHKSRTNRTVALMATVVVGKVLSRYLPPEIADEVAKVVTDEAVGLVVAGLGIVAVRFRQLANSPEDRQGVVTPRPAP